MIFNVVVQPPIFKNHHLNDQFSSVQFCFIYIVPKVKTLQEYKGNRKTQALPTGDSGKKKHPF